MAQLPRYLVSCLTIGVIWLNHHRIFQRGQVVVGADRADPVGGADGDRRWGMTMVGS